MKTPKRRRLTSKIRESRKKIKLMKLSEKKANTLKKKILKLDNQIQKYNSKLDILLNELQSENKYLEYYKNEVSYSDFDNI